jgi:hypothetical protein
VPISVLMMRSSILGGVAAVATNDMGSRHNMDADIFESAGQDFIGANTISSVHINSDYLIGEVPSSKECILTRIIHKANQNCEWARRKMYLTSTSLLFSFEGEDSIRDKIVLHEVTDHHAPDRTYI